MAQVQEIKVINIDDVPHTVDAMSEQAQRLVSVYDDWNQKEADIRNDLMIIQAAKETLSKQIIQQVRDEQAAAEKAAAAAAEVAATQTDDAPVVDSVIEPAPVADPAVAPAPTAPVDSVIEPAPVITPDDDTTQPG